MKKIGLIGGLSWQSTIDYYRFMNDAVSVRTDGKHSARIIMDSIDFNEVRIRVDAKDYDGLAELMIRSAKILENAGADMLLIGANTMHLVAPQVQAAIKIPVVHIAEATCNAIKARSFNRVGFLGTKFTMEHDFLLKIFTENGIEILIPELEDRDFMEKVIFDELFIAERNPVSKARFLRIIDDLAGKGAQGVVLGCTDIPVLINQSDCSIPLFDTTEIHALAAVEMACS